jgi:hypothetical protein
MWASCMADYDVAGGRMSPVIVRPPRNEAL